MTEEYVFPKYWALKIDDNNRKLINNWRINIIKYSDQPVNSLYLYIDNFGGGAKEVSSKETEITFDQFKEHVLGIKPEPIIEEPQDYTYLIEFLNNKQIT